MNEQVKNFMQQVVNRNPGETEFHQAVEEVVSSLFPFIHNNKQYQKWAILDRMVEPDRLIVFRVTWVDDQGEVHVNRGFRVQMNNAIGPYKGGIRFHPTVNLGVLKFLAFEQVFKNALTTLPMGGGKGGADFNPKGKSDNEVMRFCQAFVSELYRHLGPDTDIPAGDIGVGMREIGYMYGQYRKIRNDFTPVFTGKGPDWGGSLIRPEATGYGLVYFVKEMLDTKKAGWEGKVVTISGSGNVAQHAAEKALELGGKVVTLSDSCGTIYDPAGITKEKLAFIKELKNIHRGRLHQYTANFDAKYLEGKRPWQIKCDIALPCATENELNGEDARALAENGCILVAEGANMPSTPEAIRVFHQRNILFAPGKAANAGGVAVSGLEISQNNMRVNWTREMVEERLAGIMKGIHEQCVRHGTQGNVTNYVLGANLAGFVKVAGAMIDQGIT